MANECVLTDEKLYFIDIFGRDQRKHSEFYIFYAVLRKSFVVFLLQNIQGRLRKGKVFVC